MTDIKIVTRETADKGMVVRVELKPNNCYPGGIAALGVLMNWGERLIRISDAQYTHNDRLERQMVFKLEDVAQVTTVQCENVHSANVGYGPDEEWPCMFPATHVVRMAASVVNPEYFVRVCDGCLQLG